MFVPRQAYSFDDVCSLLAAVKFEGGGGQGDHALSAEQEQEQAAAIRAALQTSCVLTDGKK